MISRPPWELLIFSIHSRIRGAASLTLLRHGDYRVVSCQLAQSVERPDIWHLK